MTIVTNRTTDNTRGMWHCSTCLASALLVSFLAFAPRAQAQAQDANASGAAQTVQEPVEQELVDDIVVTAQRRSQRLQDVPVSVSVMTGAALLKANITNLENLALRTPAVRIATAPVSDFVVIRGVGSSLNLGFEQSVATFVDGVYRARSRSTRAALFDVDRVEVLKGPQTTFFGNNAIAGAFNISTRKPGDTLEANASAFYAPNYGDFSLESGLSLPVTEQLSFRVAGRASGTDGYIRETVLNRDAPRGRDLIGRVSARWQPNSTVTTNARFDIGRSRVRDPFAVELVNCPPGPAYGVPTGPCARHLAANGGVIDNSLDRRSGANPGTFRLDYHEAAQTTGIDVGANELLLTTGYYHHDYYLLNDVLGVPASQGGSVVGTTQSIPLAIAEKYNQISQEVRFQSPSDNVLSYMIGGYYAHDSFDIDIYQGLFFVPFGAFFPGVYTPTSRIAIHTFNRQSTDTRSAFAAVTIRPVEPLRINLSLRYSSVAKDARRFGEGGTGGNVPDSSNFVPGPAATQEQLLRIVGVAQSNFAQTSRTDNKWMPSASVQYEIAPDVMAYASYANGFKAGGFSAFVNASTFNPETVDAYEIGLKTQFLDRRVTLNLTGFLADYVNLQETSTVASGLTSTQIVGNVAQSRSKGVEIGASVRLIPGLTLSTDLAWLSARYSDYRDAPCTMLQAAQALAVSPTASCTQDLSGKRRAFAPDFSGNVGISYEGALTDRLKLRANVSSYFTTRFFQQPTADPVLQQPGYAKLDARLAVAALDDRWELAVVGKNLTDQQTGSFRQSVSGSIGSAQLLAEPGLSVGFQLSLNY